jgi:hypothetical protein
MWGHEMDTCENVVISKADSSWRMADRAVVFDAICISQGANRGISFVQVSIIQKLSRRVQKRSSEKFGEEISGEMAN